MNWHPILEIPLRLEEDNTYVLPTWRSQILIISSSNGMDIPSYIINTKVSPSSTSIIIISNALNPMVKEES